MYPVVPISERNDTIMSCTYTYICTYAQLRGTRIRVGGMAKGSGMIHPNMATMLGVSVFKIPLFPPKQ